MKAMLKSLEIPPNVSLGSTLLWSYLLVMVWGLMVCNFFKVALALDMRLSAKEEFDRNSGIPLSEGFWNDSNKEICRTM